MNSTLNRVGMPSMAPHSSHEESGDEEDYHAGDPGGNRSRDREHDEGDDCDYSEELDGESKTLQASVRVMLAGDVEEESGDESEDYQECAQSRGRIAAQGDPERNYAAGHGLASGSKTARSRPDYYRVPGDERVQGHFRVSERAFLGYDGRDLAARLEEPNVRVRVVDVKPLKSGCDREAERLTVKYLDVGGHRELGFLWVEHGRLL